MEKRELVQAVKDYAMANYDKGGWDVIVECYDDEQIAEVIGGSKTLRGALRNFSFLVSVWSDRQADARNSAF